MNNTFFGRLSGLCLMLMVSHWALAEDRQPALSAASVEGTESPVAAWGKARASADFSGLVLIIRGDEILFEQGFGLADKENNQAFSVGQFW